MVAIRQAERFALGKIVATRGALAAMEAAGQHPLTFLLRHLSGDWGEVCGGDWALNDEAVERGDRILSFYRTSRGDRLWIITEWDRSSTCILLPDEY